MSFYGDSMRWWVGRVISVKDPLKVGRLRVRIYGVHNDDIAEVPERDLPWASVLLPSTEAGVSGIGRSTGIKAGAQVMGFFMDGGFSQQPIVWGSIPRMEKVDKHGPHATSSSSSGNEIDDPTIPKNERRSPGRTPEVRISGTLPDMSAAVGSNNTEKAFNFLVGNGFTQKQSAAICGNFIQESGMNPDIESSFPGEESFGIAQWNPAAKRRQQLESYAAQRELSYKRLETQLEFFLWDFSENSPKFFAYNRFKQTVTINAASDLFCDKYERPHKDYAHKAARRKNARQVFEAYGSDT